MVGVKGVLNLDRDILDANGIDGRRIDYLCTEVTKLHCLHVRQLVDGISRLDHLGIGSHETIHIRPDLQNLCI